MAGQNWLRRRTVVYNPPLKPVQPARRFSIGRILWLALKRTAMVIGFVMLFSAFIGTLSAFRLKEEKAPSLPDKMVLLLDMGGPRVSARTKYLEEFGFGSRELTVPEMVDAMDRGAKDDRVQALALFIEPKLLGISDFQELRSAVHRFRETGKPVRAYADSFGGGGSGLGLYYLATAADEIWMQPVGVVAIPGLSAELPFARGLLEKVGVTPQFFQRKEYKTAMEHFTSYEMSPASREQTTELIGDIGDQISDAISVDRQKIGANVNSLIDMGLFTDEEALKYGLVDKIDYRDVFVDSLRQKIGGNAKDRTPDFISLEEYVSASPVKPEGHHPQSVALISIEGMIVEGEGGGGALGFNEQLATSADIADAIMQAARDDSIKAIVLRINSPGGTPTAAETIYRAIVRAKTQFKKQIIVSMGATAASGGYWIAAPADKIYALDGTLTGSIGVVGGKFDASGLWDKLDVNWQNVSYGKNGGMWSFNRSFSPSEQERFEASLDNVYAAFIKRVTEGRKLKPAQVEEIAKGHVWTGRQAQKLGLVDVIGGQDKALDDVAVSLGAKNRAGLNIMPLPKEESPFKELMELFGTQAALPKFLPDSIKAELAPYVVQHDGRLVYEPVRLKY